MPIVNCSDQNESDARADSGKESKVIYGPITSEELEVAILKFFGDRNAGTVSDRSGFRAVLDDFARARGLI